MDLSWTVDRAEDVTLVGCRVVNDEAIPRRVRVESLFDAPVLPPRRAGVPESGWDDEGVTLRVDPGERRGFGFAAPAPPVDPPVALADVGPVDSAGSGHEGADVGDGGDDDTSTAADALGRLGDYRPPRAAVDGSHGAGGDCVTANGDDRGGGRRDEEPGVGGSGKRNGCREEVSDDAVASTGADERGQAVPESVDEWFATVDARIDRAERLTDADVETATTVVADAGGVDALAALDERVAADAERLRSVSERAATLAERAAATDAPVDALERLA